MKRYLATNLILSFLGGVILAVVIPSEARADGYIRRYVANFRTWGAPAEISTTLAALPGGLGGALIYDKNFTTLSENVVYVIISATGDTHQGARMLFSAQLDDSRPRLVDGGC